MTPTALLLHTRLACLTGLATSHHSFTLPSLILLLIIGLKWHWELIANTSIPTPASYPLTAQTYRLLLSSNAVLPSNCLLFIRAAVERSTLSAESRTIMVG